MMTLTHLGLVTQVSFRQLGKNLIQVMTYRQDISVALN